jgi:hypothetical protein
MNEILMQAVLELAMFLDLSGDDVLDPDTAVAQLEFLASILQNLTPKEQKILVQYARQMSFSEQQIGRAERAEFLLSLPKALGLEN